MAADHCLARHSRLGLEFGHMAASVQRAEIKDLPRLHSEAARAPVEAQGPAVLHREILEDIGAGLDVEHQVTVDKFLRPGGKDGKAAIWCAAQPLAGGIVALQRHAVGGAHPGRDRQEIGLEDQRRPVRPWHDRDLGRVIGGRRSRGGKRNS
ncbi:MAG TPA: hypothetical protein VEY69_01450 [Lautropia sp.]|nr:hypothetical protein [Lautropia sp.]